MAINLTIQQDTTELRGQTKRSLSLNLWRFLNVPYYEAYPIELLL